eukprot:2762877-Prymnesium_polylepis.1
MENLAAAGPQYVAPVCKLMTTLLTNVLDKPNDRRLRRVKLTHPQVAEMLGACPHLAAPRLCASVTRRVAPSRALVLAALSGRHLCSD